MSNPQSKVSIGGIGRGHLRIRKASANDAESIYRMHTASIRELCKSHYTQEQIEEWTNALRPDRYVAAMELFEFTVAEVEGEVLGLCVLDFDNAELNALYVAPSAIGNGIGRKLIGLAEELARKRSLAQLWLRATLNSVSFYERLGFAYLEPSVHPLPSGMALPCIRMRKFLPLCVEPS